MCGLCCIFFCSTRSRHTRCSLVTGVQTCALPFFFNDAVAMTGGQPVDGPLTPGDVTRQVLAEGVERCIVVTDRPDLYDANSGLGEGVTVHHRDELDALQRELRDVKGEIGRAHV